MDPEAAASVIGMDVPLVLVPYEAARQVELGETDLEAIATTGPASRWVTDRARSCLKFWKTEVGRRGFYPFDLMAAVFLREPRRFACARVSVDVRRDRTVHLPLGASRFCWSRRQTSLARLTDLRPCIATESARA
jgi:purine nucleosidase